MRTSTLDEERFGVRTGIARAVAASDVGEALDACREADVELLIARCAVSDVAAVHALERAGALLMDTLVYYSLALDGAVATDGGGATIRTVDRAADAAAVSAVAAAAFAGYVGHYHADPRLPRDACDAVYVSWAERSVLKPDVADDVLIGELEGRVVGFATLRRNTTDEAEVVLNAVAPEVQGRGIYRSLMVGAIRWAADAGAQRLLVSTQVVNVAPQKVWVRVGFEPAYGIYTFHKWFT